MSDAYHPIQRKILSDLLFGNEMKYSQLKPDEMEGSQFTFHLSKLLNLDLVVKKDEMYLLSPQGKNIANTFDTDSRNPLKQAKHSVVFCAFRKFSGKEQTLIYTRKKNPFYDHQGYPTGKVMYGEGILDTAERELFEETGLTGQAKLIGIRHFRVYFPSPDVLVEDKVMYICRIDNPEGELSGNEEGNFYWLDVSELKKALRTPLPEFQEIFQIITTFNGEITFAEQNHYPEKF